MDEIVAATPFHDYILVFTKRGKVWRVVYDHMGNLLFQAEIYKFPLNR